MAEIVPSEAAADAPEDIRLESTGFAPNELIPQRYTCDGTNANPPLRWSQVPDGTVELVLVCEDPDAPGQTFVHWMLAGIDPNLSGIEEDSLPEGTTEGLNDFGAAGYGGPCPPHGHEAHRYIFTLMATRDHLDLAYRFEPEQLRMALDGLVIAKGVVVGRYGRTEIGAGPATPTHSG